MFPVFGQYRGIAGFGATCPSPSKYIKGRGCCISADQRPPGVPKKQQCCAVNKTRVIPHPGGVSLACKPAPGNGGGGGDGSGGGSGSFRVVSVSGGTLTADHNVAENCKAGQTPELRRQGVTGTQEFGGDISSVNGKVIQFTPGPAPPKVGDSFIIYCANTGGAFTDGGSGGGLFDGGGIDLSGGLLGFSWGTILVVGAVGIGGYYLISHAGSSSGGTRKR